MSFNESLLTTVTSDQINPMLIMEYVTIDNCKDYVSTVVRNNYILMAVCILLTLLCIYFMYKQGLLNKEKKAIKRLMEDDK